MYILYPQYYISLLRCRMLRTLRFKVYTILFYAKQVTGNDFVYLFTLIGHGVAAKNSPIITKMKKKIVR